MTRLPILFATLVFASSTSLLLAADEPVEFNRDIRQILTDKCFACHGPDDNTREAELRLDSEEAAFGREKKVIVRGKPEASALIQRIFSEDEDERMPPASTNKSLTPHEKELLKRWVAEGAKWQAHWAYATPVMRAPKKFDQAANEIDGFVLERLAKSGQTFSNPADRVTLIRRLYFDLIGLPPAPAEVEAFVKDKSPDAYKKVVDSLLKSPHFGERLAIYWLDVVRYADSNGYHADKPRQVAPYRDYVISAFNSNMPYDQFVVEQLAGDLLPEATIDQRVASGFNMLLQTTDEGGAQAKEYLAKYSADRVRNTSQIFLGSTMGCCECHNHKFDPFTQQDFYSFAAFFADIQQVGVGNPLAYPVQHEADTKKLAEFDAQTAAARVLLDTATPELAAAQTEWEAKIADSLKSDTQLGPWHVLGPIKAASFDEAHEKEFVPAADIDLAKPVGDHKWTKNDQLVDGKAHSFVGDNSAVYLFRTVRVPAATETILSLGSDDSLQVWLNGTRIHNNKVSRGVVPDQDKVTAKLVEGENQLLIKVANGAGGFGFSFNTKQTGLPPNIVAILTTETESRTDAQKLELAKHYRSIAPILNPKRKEITQLEAAKKAYEAALPRSLMTVAVTPMTIKLLNRGDWMDESGPVMEPAIPQFLGSLNVEGRRANRLDLARWVVDPKNPLTARTLVNRLWKLYFGQGLATPLDDLGRQGTLPTHPDLLDWLAIEFVESGWDVQHMIRLLVSSNAYQQVSTVRADLKTLDPYNRLYGRQARFRLDAEIVRDNALAVSGLLVQDLGGTSVFPYQPAGYWDHMNFPARTWPTSRDKSLYRRGLYTHWQRMFLHPGMVAFDAPSREECTVERPRSNIPQQALVLLNDPTYVEAARAFAERVVAEGGATAESKFDWAYREVLSRGVTDREAAVLKRVFEKHLATWQKDEAAAKAFLGVGAKPMPGGMSASELAAWTSVSRVILNLHETITRS
ncbi:MAG: PSD1 and planctomycete cytochrome C domain-containing protein [Planctomycetota bacterium]|nr:PSD1 and planctomycete cytochrome C domain-containing protein [Planctomycetota bacterium]MDA1250267.1 PSD1 and planctomycete cytochrome C domain-containing protein [Planctomycetota bacterium]